MLATKLFFFFFLSSTISYPGFLGLYFIIFYFLFFILWELGNFFHSLLSKIPFWFYSWIQKQVNLFFFYRLKRSCCYTCYIFAQHLLLSDHWISGIMNWTCLFTTPVLKGLEHKGTSVGYYPSSCMPQHPALLALR